MILSFSEFMKEALYGVDGYYHNGTGKIGTEGDFLTSSNFGEIFGEIFADYFSVLLSQYNYNPVVIEIGGGSGKFSKTVYNKLKQKYFAFEYIVIEDSPFHRKMIRERFSNEDDIHIYKSIEEFVLHMPKFSSGIIFMNELLDAIPTEIVRKTKKSFEQLYVNKIDSTFKEEWHPVSEEVGTYLNRYDFIKVNENHRLEISIETSMILEQILSILPNSHIVCVDYGYSTDELCKPYLRNGSIRGYYKHQLIENVYQNYKMMDITYHIHWDEFFYQAAEKGYVKDFFSSQQEFLLENGIMNLLMNSNETDPFHPIHKRNRQIKGLLMGSGISESLQVAVVKR